MLNIFFAINLSDSIIVQVPVGFNSIQFLRMDIWKDLILLARANKHLCLDEFILIRVGKELSLSRISMPL